jgi:hypothetical protein
MGEVLRSLDHILDAQRGGGVEGGHPDTCFIVVGFWLGEQDLAEVRPHLERDPEYRDVGEVGRYRGVPLFPLSARPAGRSPYCEYQGVWFGYVPALHVD